MRAIVLLLLVILVFFGCATLGYELAGVQQSSPVQEQVEEVAALKSEQHNIILIRVDQLDTDNPRLISVWFVSVFFATNQPSSLTLGQMYPLAEGKSISKALERSFTLDDQGEPSVGFWQVLQDNGFAYEGYVLIDSTGANEALNWLLGPGDYYAMLDAAESDQSENRRLADQICASILQTNGQDISLFNWSGLVPKHFRSNLRMESGMMYWARITETKNSMRCDVIASQ